MEGVAPGKAAMLTGSQGREEGTAVMQRVRGAPGSGLRLLFITPEKVLIGGRGGVVDGTDGAAFVDKIE